MTHRPQTINAEKHDPLQLRTHGPAPSEGWSQQLPSCGVNQVCEPAGLRVERVLLLDGPREVEVVQECHCEMKLTQCVRVPALKTYYSETPYETVLDVGRCSSSKGPQGESPRACGFVGNNLPTLFVPFYFLLEFLNSMTIPSVPDDLIIFIIIVCIVCQLRAVIIKVVKRCCSTS